MLDPSQLFQPRQVPGQGPTLPMGHQAQPTVPLMPQVQPTAGIFRPDQLSVSQLAPGHQPQQIPASQPLLSPLPVQESAYPSAMPSNLIKESFVTKLMFGIKSPLLLFNRQDPDAIVKTNLKDVHGNPIRLARDAAAGLEKIQSLVNSKGLTMRVVSSYRTVEQQTYLWEKALKKYGSAAAARKWVAPPGKSRHNSGKAIDLYLYKNGKQIPQSQFDDLIKQAGMYRPMSWEGWHIEPLSTQKTRAASHDHSDD